MPPIFAALLHAPQQVSIWEIEQDPEEIKRLREEEKKRKESEEAAAAAHKRMIEEQAALLAAAKAG